MIFYNFPDFDPTFLTGASITMYSLNAQEVYSTYYSILFETRILYLLAPFFLGSRKVSMRIDLL